MESASHESGDALDQLKDLSEKVDDGWRFVAYCLQKATYEYVEVDEATYTALELDFWHEHAQLLEREEERQPGISHKIIIRFEEIAAELRKAEDDHFASELRRHKRKAFVRGLLGLTVEPMTYEDIMASRQHGDGIADL